MLEINQTLLFQMIGFVALLFILNRLLYKPLLQVLKDREERIEGTIKAATETEKSVEDGLASYEKKLKEAAIKGTEARNKLKAEALEREKETIDAAREAAGRELGRMQGEIARSKASALSTLKEETSSISRSIAEKILERKLAAFLIMLLPLMATTALAATEGGHGEGHAGSIFNMEFLWKTVNFAILVVGIIIIWKKLISGLLEKRSQGIKQAIEDARSAKEAADKKAVEYKSKLSMLEKRLSEIQAEFASEGEAEKKRIIAEAEAASISIKEQARVAAEQEVKKAKLEIREEVARLAVGMAEEILKRELSPADQERLVKGNLQNLRLN
ncbi:MAG: ATP synthase F0 subunit B [Deltaproteobacteria bacterium]|nr:ATP synthase F0 subunit B [Deltaproteobacteria bacterium]